MTQLFSSCFLNGLLASFMILAVLAVRPLLRKAPRNITCVLWLLIAVRLLLPFRLESPLSLQPHQLVSHGQLTMTLHTAPSSDVPFTDVPAVSPTSPPVTAHTQTTRETVLSVIWAAGCLSVLIYTAVSYIILKFRVRDAVKTAHRVWECQRINGAFLLGYVHPRICIPADLNLQDRRFVIAHEQAHLKRGDHWWKLLGIVCLSIHWYNPLVWLSYTLLCRDIEVACDERVIRDLELGERKSYSFALLNSGKRLSGFLTYPVAFGEISLKTRIKNVLNYRKPRLGVTLSALTVAAVIAICFMTTPTTAHPTLAEENSGLVQTTQSTTEAPTTTTTEVAEPETQPPAETTAPPEPVTEPPIETTAPIEPVKTGVKLPKVPIFEDVSPKPSYPTFP